MIELNSKTKINILGAAGAGKSTLAKYLSKKYNLKRVELDSIFWKPNWTASTDEEFKRNVMAEINGQVGWIVEGGTPVREVFWQDLDVVIWLDYPLPLIIFRIARRTFLRVFITKEKMCGENRENFIHQYFSSKSILYSALKSFWAAKKFYHDLLSQTKSSHIRVYRIKTPKELRRLLGND